MLARALRTFLPETLLRELASELKASFKHRLGAAQGRAQLRGRRELKANIGCGGSPLPGWANLDLVTHPGVIRWDCRHGLPFDDQSVKFIFAEHLYEHFERPSGTSSFLAECMRCLEPGGVLRVIVPDAGMYLRAYGEDGWGTLDAVRPLEQVELGLRRDFWIPRYHYRTKMELINAVFRQDTEHKFAYDAETLIMDLKSAGFSQVVQQEFGRSLLQDPPPDTPARRTESLYVEAAK